MGIVTDYLVTLVSRQVDAAGIVVWYDPDHYYGEVASNLALPNTTIALYRDSFFALRREIELLLEGLELPRLVVYVPLDPVETHNALIEVETAGVVMKPGQQPPIRNTRPSLIARNALKAILLEDRLGKIEKQVEGVNLSLAELDALAEKGEGITKGMLSLIFRAENPQEIALSFLTDEHHDKELVQKGALPELTSLLQQPFEVDLPVGETAESYRVRLARHILATDFIAGIPSELPAALATVKTAARPSTREACMAVARTWRLRRDLTESYAAHANRVEKEFGLAALHFTLEQLASGETFQVVERKLQELVTRELLAEATDALVRLAVTRQSSFWAEYLPEMQAQWALIVAAAQVLLEADRIEQALKTTTHDAGAIFRAYITGQRPWCLLDTCYRRMEHRYYDFGFQLQDQDEQLLTRARQRYMHVDSTLAETFLRAYKEQKFHMEGVLRQLDIFKKKVSPALSRGKVAYVWVDALRYEMGYELAQSLAAEAEAHIEAALGTVPTITEIGMASLLPIAQEPVSVVAVGESKLALEIDGTCIKERKDRVTYLTSHAGPGVRVFEAKLEDLLPKPGKKVRDGISSADLVLITSQEIDAIGEEGNISLARQTMDEILRQLRKAFRVLGQLGVKTIIYTADHGHLFADELSDDMKIDAPGGDTRDLHRRVWIGHGGTADASYLRARLADFGLGGGLEIAVPWNFACFKVKGGAEAYFHGGMSPQELFIPVVVLSPRRGETGTIGAISWSLMPGSQKISTRLYSVQITGSASSLFEMVPPKVRLEVRNGAQTISLPISASYGFEEATGDVQLKRAEQDSRVLEPDTVTLVITDPQSKATVSVHLFDAISGVELARLDKIEMAIAI
jgi:PglZ domain